MSLPRGLNNRRSNNITRIGLFGGTFNPIHNGHIKMAEAARKEYRLNSVYFIPSGIPPHRKKDLYPTKLRYKLVQEAVKNKKYFKVLDIELKSKVKSYTVETINRLKDKTYSKLIPHDSKLYFLIGADEFENLKQWKDPKKLAEMVTFLVLPRPEEKIKIPKIKNLRWQMVHTKPINISSTEVRDKIRNKKSIRDLVPDRLLSFLQRLVP